MDAKGEVLIRRTRYDLSKKCLQDEDCLRFMSSYNIKETEMSLLLVNNSLQQSLAQSEPILTAISSNCILPKIEEDRVALAEALTSEATGPEEILQNVFDGAMQRIQEEFNQIISSSVKETIFNQVKQKPLRFIKDVYKYEVAMRVFAKLDTGEVRGMLKEHRREGRIRDDFNQVGSAWRKNKEAIKDKLVKLGENISEPFTAEILVKLLDNGILDDLPESKKERIRKYASTNRWECVQEENNTVSSDIIKKITAIGLLVLLGSSWAIRFCVGR